MSVNVGPQTELVKQTDPLLCPSIIPYVAEFGRGASIHWWEYYLLTYLFTRPTRHPSDLKDRFGLSRRVIDLDMWVGSCIPYVQTGGVGGGLGESSHPVITHSGPGPSTAAREG